MYTGIRLLLFALYSFFFLSNFQTLKFFVTLFSRTVRPGRLKLGTHVDSGQMYRVYRNQAAAYSSPYFFIFFLSNFQTLKISSHFSQELWGLEVWNLVHTWTVGGCMVYTRIRLLLLLIRPFIVSFSKIQIFKFSSHFSQELWGLEGWNLVHTWTMGGCIVCTRIRRLLIFVPLFFIFLSLQFLNIKKFLSHLP